MYSCKRKHWPIVIIIMKRENSTNFLMNREEKAITQEGSDVWLFL